MKKNIKENDIRFQLNGGFYWQPENGNEADFLGENENDDVDIENENDSQYEALNDFLQEDMTTANMSVSDQPITLMRNKTQNYDPYKGAQNISKDSKTIIGKDDNFLHEKKITKILTSLYEEVNKGESNPLIPKSFDAKQNIAHEITDPYKGNIFDDEESKDEDKTKMGCSTEYEDNKEIIPILESLITEAEKFDTEKRKKLADEGEAEPDGSFPIRDKKDLKNAVHDFGRAGAKQSDKNWIKKRAKALGDEKDLPDNWKKESYKHHLNQLIESVGNKKRSFNSKTQNNLNQLIEAVSKDNVQNLLNKYNELNRKDAFDGLSDKEKSIKDYIFDELSDMGYFNGNSVNHDLMRVDEHGNFVLKTNTEKTNDIDDYVHKNFHDENNDDADLQPLGEDDDYEPHHEMPSMDRFHKQNIEYMNKIMKGKRVELIYMKDDYTDLKPGDKGTINFIDDIGQIHVDWDNGSKLALIPEVDRWRMLKNGLGEAKKKKSKSDKKFDKVMGEFGKGKLHSGSKKGPKVTDEKQAVAIAYSESGKDKEKKNESKGLFKLTYLNEGKLNTLVVNKSKFSKFIKENCQVKENFNLEEYLASRTYGFKQTLIEEYISFARKKNK